MKINVSDDSSEDDEVAENDHPCFYCGEMFTKSVAYDGWIQCSLCKRWAHDLCAGVDEETDFFQCEYCNSEC